MPGPPNTPNPALKPGLQYPTLPNADAHTQGVMKNIFDNLFYIHRELNTPRPLSPQQLNALEQRLISQVIDNIVNNNTFNLTGVFITGTHNLRITTYGAAAQDTGTGFFETDRNVVYIITDSPKKWRFAAGVMLGELAAQPADLGVYDASFLYFATDTDTLYIWDGTAWVAISGGGGGEGSGYYSPILGGSPGNPEFIQDGERWVVGWNPPEA